MMSYSWPGIGKISKQEREQPLLLEYIRELHLLICVLIFTVNHQR